MNLRFLSLLAVSAALVSGSLTAAAAPHKHSRSISQAQAVKIAKKRVDGGRVTDIDLDRDDGRPHYDVEIVKNGQEYKVVVDARTGRVISSRRDD